MKKNILWEKVNFSLSVLLIGSSALLGIVLIFEADEKTNPIAQVIANTVYADAER